MVKPVFFDGIPDPEMVERVMASARAVFSHLRDKGELERLSAVGSVIIDTTVLARCDFS